MDEYSITDYFSHVEEVWVPAAQDWSFVVRRWYRRMTRISQRANVAKLTNSANCFYKLHVQYTSPQYDCTYGRSTSRKSIRAGHRVCIMDKNKRSMYSLCSAKAWVVQYQGMPHDRLDLDAVFLHPHFRQALGFGIVNLHGQLVVTRGWKKSAKHEAYVAKAAFSGKVWPWEEDIFLGQDLETFLPEDCNFLQKIQHFFDISWWTIETLGLLRLALTETNSFLIYSW